MKYFLALSFFFSFVVFASDINSDLQGLQKINPEVACATCAQPLSHEKASVIKDINNEKLELTVLGLDEANAIVTDFLNDKNIPFDYALDGCFARAHKMASLLDQNGIITGKAFVIGRLFAKTKYGPASWRYHVAPVVLVKIKDEIKPYIIDPALFSTAVPYEEWKNLITGITYNGRRTGPPAMEYYSNRFVYDPTNPRAKLTEFSSGDLADADSTLAKLMEIKKQLDAR